MSLQKEKEVLALLSRLDLNNVHFTSAPPGIIIFTLFFSLFASYSQLFTFSRIPLELVVTIKLHMVGYTGDANLSVHLVASEGLEAYLPLAAMVDISSEVQRISKRLSKMQTEYDALVTRLSSPKVYHYH